MASLTGEEAHALLAEAASVEATAAWGDLLTATVEEVSALEEAGVASVLVGSLALALTTGAVGVGPPPDSIDLLVPAVSAAGSAAVLDDRGWQQASGVELADLLVARHGVRYEIVVVRPDRTSPDLTLLWHLLADRLDVHADAGRIARADRRMLTAPGREGYEVRVATATDQLLALAAAAAGVTSPPPQVDLDVAALVASGLVDPDLLEGEACSAHLGWMVAAALDRLPDNAAAVLPAPVLERLRADRPRGAAGWYARHRTSPTWGALDAPARFVARHVGIVARGRPVRSVSTVAAHVRVARAPEDGRHSISGQAMNGQVGRRLVVQRLAAALPVEAAFETGTHLGRTTPYLAALLGCEVWTAEADPASAARARQRFEQSPALHVCEGDSPEVLARLTAHLGPGRTFFYLDAHWQSHLPLWDELAVVFAHAPDPVVLIDDFAVPSDPGYGYDDYGPGQVLDLEHLAPHVPSGFSCWFPTVPSSAETGSVRGCVVVARDEHASVLAGCLLEPVATVG